MANNTQVCTITFGDGRICPEYCGMGGVPTVLLRFITDPKLITKPGMRVLDIDFERTTPVLGLRFKDKEAVDVVTKWLKTLSEDWDEILKEVQDAFKATDEQGV